MLGTLKYKRWADIFLSEIIVTELRSVGRPRIYWSGVAGLVGGGWSNGQCVKVSIRLDVIK